MSTQTIQAAIDAIRNQTVQYGNTRMKVADLLTLINNEKLNREEVEAMFGDVMNQAPAFFEWLETGEAVIKVDSTLLEGAPGDPDYFLYVDAAGELKRSRWSNVQQFLTAGWSMQTEEIPVTVNSEQRVVRKITGYTGGTGTLPQALADTVGKYFAAAGGFTSDVALATDYKGEASENKINTWTAKAYNAGEQVIYEGKIYEANASVLATDVPGSSTKWVEKLAILNHINDVFPLGLNILNPDNHLENKYIHPSTGLPFDASWAGSFWYLRIKPNTEYSFNNCYQVAWYDKDKNLIGVVSSSAFLFSPVNAVFLSVDFDKTLVPMAAEGHIYPLEYEPFSGVSGIKIPNFINDNLVEKDNDLFIGKKDTERNITYGEFLNNDLRMFIEGGNQNFFTCGAGPLVMPTGQTNYGAGTQALSKVTTGVANYASGAFALRDLIDGHDNTATGVGAMQKLQGGIGNTSSGRLSLANLINNGHNSAYGDTCYERLEDGANNTGSGYGCGIGLKQGNGNSLFGVYAGGHPQGGDPLRPPTAIWSNNSGVGSFSMQYNESSSNNSYVGKGAFFNLVSGDGYNVGIGTECFYDGVSISFNVGVGNKAGGKLVSGVNNVFVGNRCGGETGQKTDAVGTTVIGAGAISTRDNEVVIGKATDTHATICGVEFTKAQLQALKNLVS